MFDMTASLRQLIWYMRPENGTGFSHLERTDRGFGAFD